MAFILHIETATKVCSVALSESGKLIDSIDFLGDGYEHGEKLTILIQQLLHKNKFTLDRLNAVSVSAGPGSYTGLRIGVSTAKGLCYALNIPLIAIDTLFAMAEVAWEKYPNQTLMPMIDARRMEVFSIIYARDKSILRQIEAEILEEGRNTAYEPFVCFGDGAEKTSTVWQNRNIIIDNEIQPSARGQIVQAFEKFKAEQVEDVAYFEPNYLKEFYMAPPKIKA